MNLSVKMAYLEQDASRLAAAGTVEPVIDSLGNVPAALAGLGISVKQLALMVTMGSTVRRNVCVIMALLVIM